MSNTLHPAVRLSQTLLKPTFIATFALLGILGGVIPNLSPSATGLLSFDSRAVAQSFSSEEITNYSRAVLAIERLRQPAFSEIKRMMSSSSMPAVICNQSDSASRLPDQARKIFVDYCQQSKNIVETNGLTSSRFNEITTLLRSNPELHQKVRTELIRLQK